MSSTSLQKLQTSRSILTSARNVNKLALFSRELPQAIMLNLFYFCSPSDLKSLGLLENDSICVALEVSNTRPYDNIFKSFLKEGVVLKEGELYKEKFNTDPSARKEIFIFDGPGGVEYFTSRLVENALLELNKRNSRILKTRKIEKESIEIIEKNIRYSLENTLVTKEQLLALLNPQHIYQAELTEIFTLNPNSYNLCIVNSNVISILTFLAYLKKGDAIELTNDIIHWRTECANLLVSLLEKKNILDIIKKRPEIICKIFEAPSVYLYKFLQKSEKNPELLNGKLSFSVFEKAKMLLLWG